MTTLHAAEAPPTERWSALGGVLLSALYLWVVVWLLVAVLVPAFGLGWRPVVITTGSMQPLIRPGDVVLSAVDAELETGQVITYEDPARPGTLTTHRVLSVNEDGTLRTQGDANAGPDSTPVPRDNVLGRGRLLVPMIGLPLLWLSGGAVLFGLWVVVTAVSVAVVAGASGAPRTVRHDGAVVPGSVERRPLLRRLRPRAVQRAVVTALAHGVRRVHDAVYRGHRRNPSRLRRGLPGITVVALVVLLARSTASVTLGLVVLALVLLFDPDGPQFRIGRWEQVAAQVVRTATAVVPAGLGGRGIIAIAMVVAVAGASVGRSAATFSAAADNSGSTFSAAATFPSSGLTLYLQNDPEGQDTVDQQFQPMTTAVPTQTALPNYDTNVDSSAGLRIQNGGSDQHEADVDKVQRWTHTPSSDLTISGATVVFHSAMKDFAIGKDATVTWYLRHCAPSGGDCIELTRRTLSSADWSGGQGGFAERTADLGTLSQVVPAGRQLQLAVIVPTAGSDMWFAYDTAAQPSRLELTTPSSSACPGTGTWTGFARADTRVDQNDPTTNFATAKELDVVSDTVKNRRTLVQVALPTIPAGCTMTGATLRLTTRSSKTGRTFVAQRLDAAFDPTTVTWATQPTASGPLGSGPATANGPTPIDVLGPVSALYAQGNTGLVLRDSVEGSASTASNRFHSLESRPYPDPEGPRLEITWGP